MKGSAPKAEDLLKEVKKTLQRYGLSTKGDPKEVVEAMKKVDDER
jgi:hypothetical protein